MESIRQFDAVFAEGTRVEQKEFVNLFVERIDVDAEKSKATVRIRKFPAPQTLGTGNDLLVLVAGARDEHQKIAFPPVDVVEIPLIRRGNVLVPVAVSLM